MDLRAYVRMNLVILMKIRPIEPPVNEGGSSMHPGMVDSSHSQMKHNCPKCGRNYKWPSSLRFHLVNECGKEPQQKCPICAYKTKQKSNLSKHIKLVHGVMIG
ncbi:longitudinals lacking protein, isoforms A/B/D/L-like [Bemisia tabaci]|uniref:longitudinals lacking protein, isoforms A/B/D/L-like n=1 Tax=Bemisia tabaci TaxID=7038 RepID=UPI003B289F75